MIETPYSCPCGSGLTFAECCRQVHSNHTKATTAEALMRARYSAFAVGNIDFLYNTFHPTTRRFQHRDAIQQWAQENKWKQLNILKATSSTVEFEAHYLDSALQVQIHHEKSTFKQQGDLWYYVDGR